jgi:hypothetical protein
MFELLSASIDVVHALAMLVWGVGLPLLFWHRWPALSRGYMVYSLVFIAASVASQLVLGECFLTTMARDFAEQGSNTLLRERASFTVRLVEMVAGLRPTERLAVRLWELAVFVTCMGMLVHMWRRSGHVTPEARARFDAGSSATQH